MKNITHSIDNIVDGLVDGHEIKYLISALCILLGLSFYAGMIVAQVIP